jgi:GNAT superfamily N-acetyltransferase
MQSLDIQQVSTQHQLKRFATFPWKIYKDDPLWVAPLLKDRMKFIDESSGPFFEHGKAEFFIARRGGRRVGTICTAIDEKANQTVNKKECVFGFFECINDPEVARSLLDHARLWAEEHGMESLYGPFNLDYEDAYGVLVGGRDRPPAILCGHTPDYYQTFIEDYGFKPARGENLAFARDLTTALKELDELNDFAARVKERRQFTIRSADISHWEEEVDKVYELINPCLAHIPGFEPWQPEALHELMAPFVDLADPELILFAEDQGKPIGFFPALPNFNEILIHIDGLRYPWDYLKAAWYSRQKPKSAAVKSVLVLPEYWGSGVAIMLFAEMASRLRAAGYEWVDLSLTSDDNPRTPVLAERIGAKIYKRYQVYRLTF